MKTFSMILIKLVMILTTVNTHILQQVIQQLYKLPYNEVNSLIDSITYDIQNHTWDDELPIEQRNPVGFQVNNDDITDEEDDGDNGDDGFCD